MFKKCPYRDKVFERGSTIFSHLAHGYNEPEQALQNVCGLVEQICELTKKQKSADLSRKHTDKLCPLVHKAKIHQRVKRRNKLAYVLLYVKLEDMLLKHYSLITYLRYIEWTKYPQKSLAGQFFKFPLIAVIGLNSNGK